MNDMGVFLMLGLMLACVLVLAYWLRTPHHRGLRSIVAWSTSIRDSCRINTLPGRFRTRLPPSPLGYVLLVMAAHVSPAMLFLCTTQHPLKEAWSCRRDVEWPLRMDHARIRPKCMREDSRAS